MATVTKEGLEHQLKI